MDSPIDYYARNVRTIDESLGTLQPTFTTRGWAQKVSWRSSGVLVVGLDGRTQSVARVMLDCE